MKSIAGHRCRFAVMLALNVTAAYLSSLIDLACIQVDNVGAYMVAPVLIPVEFMGSIFRGDLGESLAGLVALIAGLVFLTARTFQSHLRMLVPLVLWAFSTIHGMGLYFFCQ
jgi:hypothetical protein